MKKWIYAAAAAMILLMGSCAKAEASREMFAMDTVISVKAYGANCEEAVRAASEKVKELEKLFSVTDPKSDISAINTYGSADVSDSTAYVISEALNVCGDTNGALDITIYPALLKWGFTASETRVPTDAELASALGKTGYENVTVSGNTVTVPEGYMLDLGSCAKGYAGSEMIAVLSEHGVTSAIVNLGGNVQTLGAKPDGTDWTVGITDPFSPNELLGTVGIRDKAVITSGGYQRYFTDEHGNVYIHILDPATGKPAHSGLSSVTVIGENGLLCDALSTAMFVMGKEKTVEYWRDRCNNIDLILVTDDGVICVTEGISGSFANSSGMPVEIIYEQ